MSHLAAQSVTSSVTNVLKYGLGNEMTINGKERKEYAENLADVRLGFNRLKIGFRLELSDPPEFGVRYSGLRKKYIEFEQDGVTLRAGDLYALFNRGTSLNMFENRTLAYDTGIEGAYAQYRTTWFRAAVVSGVLDFVDPITVYLLSPRHDRYSLRGALAEVTPFPFISLGASFVSSDADITNTRTLVPDKVKADLPEMFMTVRTELVDLFASYTLRNVYNKNTGKWEEGNAFYGSIAHSGEGYGITLEYKDYRFDIVDPSGADPFRITRMMPFQNPPTVKKEHSYTTLSRNPHLVDFNDEVGVQLDLYYCVMDGTTLNLGGSMASRHYQYLLNRSTFISARKENGSPLLPLLDQTRSPFWEVTMDIEHFLNEEGSYVKGGFDRRHDYTFFEFGSTYINMTGMPVQFQWMMDETWSVKTTVEPLWIYHSAYQTDKSSFDLLISFQISKSPEWSAGIRRESTTNPFDPTHRSVWIAVDGSYRIGSTHTIMFSLGDERGGQVCANGICRQINPFSGFRFSMINQL